MTGSGKTMLLKLLDGLPGFYTPKFNYVLEQICILADTGSMNYDDATALVKLIVDQNRFDYSISREINFRANDLSSVWKSKKILGYLANLVKENSNEQELLTSPKGLIYLTHQLLNKARLIETAFPNEMVQILCVRHPLYLFDHWKSYINNHGSNPRDFTLCRSKNNQMVPWFIESNTSLFTKCNDIDKTALAIAELTIRSIQLMKSTNNRKIITIDFEKFVLNPDKYLCKINSIFPFEKSKIDRILKNENVPRGHINQSISKKVYVRYNSSILDTELDHKSDYLSNLDRVRSHVSSEIWVYLNDSIEQYEQEFGLWF